jgi:hypothetical protein
VEISPILMELVVKVFMGKNLQTKISKLNIPKEVNFQWQMQDLIPMEANFLLLLKILLYFYKI